MGALTLGALNLLGAGTGVVVTVLGAVGVGGAFLLAVTKKLHEDFRHASGGRKAAFVAGCLGLATVLTLLGLLTRETPAPTRMPGTRDVAILGFRAPTEQLQGEYDDLAASLARALPSPDDGSVRDYTGETDAPLELFGAAAPVLGPTDRWMSRFVDAADPELVIAGYASGQPPGPSQLDVYAFVPSELLDDAVELTGWHLLAAEPLDGSIGSAATRGALIDRLVLHLGSLSSFMAGLDAWNAGHHEAARSALAAVGRESAGQPSLVDPLARLLRGHALEALAQITPADREQLLQDARADYESLLADPVVAPRARLSLATNEYLRVLAGGCAAGPRVRQRLERTSETLASLATDSSLTELVRLKAKVNQAQVEQCRSFRRSPPSRTLTSLVEELVQLPLASDDPQLRLKQQIRALAHAIDASTRAQADDLPGAVRAVDQALALDARFERQALWLGLKSSWLLAQGCDHLGAGQAAQQASLSSLTRAIERKRLPAGARAAYERAFRTDLRTAQDRCR